MSHLKCSKIYYNKCAEIDQHNRHRQDNLHIEQKFQIKTWVNRVPTSIFGVYCVYEWLVYCERITDSLHPDPQINQQYFYSALVEELSDNNIRLSRN